MQYLEGYRAMMNCSDEYNETARVVMVINMVSKICAMVIQHVVLMLPIATSDVHVGLMGRHR
jgi:hypothetical protein